MSQTALSYSVKPPLSQRINFRMIIIVAVFAVLVGYPVITFVRAQLDQGIEQDGNLYRVNLKALGDFVFDDVNGTINDVPAKWRKLDGKRVALEGFMWAGTSASDKVPQFQFVYNITKCCFNGPPLVQERVFAFVRGGDVEYHSDECRISGILHVKVQRDDAGKVSSVYTIDVDRAEAM